MSGDDVAERLLHHLRLHLEAPDISYAEPPSPISGGFDTAIYGFRVAGADNRFNVPMILRLFRPESDPQRAAFDAVVQNEIADQGYPAPRVLQWSADPSILGGGFMLMERASGRPMLDLFLRPSLAMVRLPGVLAGTQLRLHGLDAAPLADAVASRGLSQYMNSPAESLAYMARVIDQCSLDGLRPGRDWLAGSAPTASERKVICHSDYHPLNILMADGAVTGVIDWSMTTIEDAAFDVGATRALMSSGPVDAPFLLRPIARFGRGAIVGAYYRAYVAGRRLDRDAVRYYEALRSLLFLGEAAERRLADAGVIAPVTKPSAFAAAGVAERIASRFRNLTGVDVHIPPAVPG